MVAVRLASHRPQVKVASSYPCFAVYVLGGRARSLVAPSCVPTLDGGGELGVVEALVAQVGGGGGGHVLVLGADGVLGDVAVAGEGGVAGQAHLGVGTIRATVGTS